MKAKYESMICLISPPLYHSHATLLRMKSDPVSEVCLLVNTYNVTLPYHDDLFIDQQTLDDFLSVSRDPVKSVKKVRSSPGESKMEKLSVVGLPLAEIRRRVAEINRKINGKWSCTLCGKEAATKQNSEIHIETHIQGVEFLCNLCNKKLRSTSGAKYHKCKRRETGA